MYRAPVVYVAFSGYYSIVGTHSGGATLKSITSGFEFTCTMQQLEEFKSDARSDQF